MTPCFPGLLLSSQEYGGVCTVPGHSQPRLPFYLVRRRRAILSNLKFILEWYTILILSPRTQEQWKDGVHRRKVWDTEDTPQSCCCSGWVGGGLDNKTMPHRLRNQQPGHTRLIMSDIPLTLLSLTHGQILQGPFLTPPPPRGYCRASGTCLSLHESH